MQLSSTLTPKKAQRRAASIRGYLKAGIISAHELGKLIGKLCFPQTCLFGQCARAQLRFYTVSYTPRATSLSFLVMNSLLSIGGMTLAQAFHLGSR